MKLIQSWWRPHETGLTLGKVPANVCQSTGLWLKIVLGRRVGVFRDKLQCNVNYAQVCRQLWAGVILWVLGKIWISGWEWYIEKIGKEGLGGISHGDTTVEDQYDFIKVYMYIFKLFEIHILDGKAHSGRLVCDQMCQGANDISTVSSGVGKSYFWRGWRVKGDAVWYPKSDAVPSSVAYKFVLRM